MRKEAAVFLTDRARFWVVRPRMSTSGVSGLETLVSGAYIAVDPGPEGGEEQLAFTGLEDPPIVRSDVAGHSLRPQGGPYRIAQPRIAGVLPRLQCRICPGL